MKSSTGNPFAGTGEKLRLSLTAHSTWVWEATGPAQATFH